MVKVIDVSAVDVHGVRYRFDPRNVLDVGFTHINSITVTPYKSLVLGILCDSAVITVALKKMNV